MKYQNIWIRESELESEKVHNVISFLKKLSKVKAFEWLDKSKTYVFRPLAFSGLQ